jgi:hypothetical protein
MEGAIPDSDLLCDDVLAKGREITRYPQHLH